MTVLREIKNIKVEGEFHTCPECGYVLGFHTSFLKLTASKDSPVKSTRDVYQVILICPECGMQYDVGWRVTFSESENRVVRTSVHQVSPSQTY
jgi:predicted RNA-binding Zn-ribbon protein involved in translation (DUF1610 family)